MKETKLLIFISSENSDSARTIFLLRQAITMVATEIQVYLDIIDLKKMSTLGDLYKILATPTILREGQENIKERRIIGHLNTIEAANKAIEYLIN